MRLLRFTHCHDPDDDEGYPHTFTPRTYVQMGDLEGVALWCREHFGPRGTPRWDIGFIVGFIYLADDDDAFAFKMRWC